MVSDKYIENKQQNGFNFVLTKECYDPIVRSTAIALLRHIVEKNEIITYLDLTRKMDIKINPRNLANPLGYISEACQKNEIPLVSVMVVNSNSYQPGDGFYKWFFPHLNRDEWGESQILCKHQLMV